MPTVSTVNKKTYTIDAVVNRSHYRSIYTQRLQCIRFFAPGNYEKRGYIREVKIFKNGRLYESVMQFGYEYRTSRNGSVRCAQVKPGQSEGKIIDPKTGRTTTNMIYIRRQ